MLKLTTKALKPGEKEKGDFFSPYSFDISYYSNVKDNVKLTILYNSRQSIREIASNRLQAVPPFICTLATSGSNFILKQFNKNTNDFQRNLLKSVLKIEFLAK